MASIAFLGLGSNVEPRRKYLQAALQVLGEHPQIEILAKSPIYVSQSVEGGGETDFLNAVLRIETDLSPQQLLGFIQQVERDNGRERAIDNEHRVGTRTLDIDILRFDDLTIDEPDLQIPHPRMSARAFVLRPLLDVQDSGWVEMSREQWD